MSEQPYQIKTDEYEESIGIYHNNTPILYFPNTDDGRRDLIKALESLLNILDNEKEEWKTLVLEVTPRPKKRD